MCSCEISNIIYFTLLQLGLGTAKTLPLNTSLILQAMAIFAPDWNSAARLADSDMEAKLKASIIKFTLSWFLFGKVI